MLRKRKTPGLLLLCLIAGTLDAIAAILLSWGHPASGVFKYIASGGFGTKAFKGGTNMVIWGLVFHYLIASFYSILFFFLYPGLKKIITSRIAIVLIIGIVIQIVMSFVVLPLSNVPKRPGGPSITGMLIGAGVLCITIGVPVVIIAGKYFKKRL